MRVCIKKTAVWVCVILFVSAIGNFGYGKTNNQPFMETALTHLEKALGMKIGKGIHLNKAKMSLELGASDKGGHRILALNKTNKALEAFKLNDFTGADTFIREAIVEVNAGIAYSDVNTNNQPTGNLDNQPFMGLGLKNLNLALNAIVISEKVIHLEDAKKNLNSATSDKGGHRVAAINKIIMSLERLNHNHIIQANVLIREAIQQVKMGIEAGAAK
jgi:hypothetical protein